MKLYIMRHGQAAAPAPDREQILTSDGKIGIEKLAAHLYQKKISLQRIVHSQKMRARQTAEIIASALLANDTLQTLDNILPNSDPQHLLNSIQAWRKNTLIVSHLPFIPSFIALLMADNTDDRFISYEPGTILCLTQINAHWAIEWTTAPSTLIQQDVY